MDYLLILFVIVVVVIAVAWAYGIFPINLIMGSGKILSQKIDVSKFNRVSLKGSGDVYIEQGEGESLVIEADDNILPLLESRVQGNELILSTKPNARFRPSRAVVYRIMVRDLTGASLLGSGNFYVSPIFTDRMDISLLGSGNIKLKELTTTGSLNFDMNGSGNFNVEHLDVNSVNTHVKGSGDIKLAGKAEKQDISISGSGNYDGGNMETDSAEVSIPGSGNVKVWAHDQLNVKILGSGTVQYFGHPAVAQSVLGSGKVVSLGEK